MRISEFLDRKITPECWKSRKPEKIEIKDIEDISWPVKGNDIKFEQEVFRFLLQNQKELGLQTIYRLKNSGIDGLLILDDDRSVAIEIKYRMNWLKACQANLQFQGFLERIIFATEYQPKIGVVFFEDFSGDWLRIPSIRKNENGWNFWYAEHHYLPGQNFKIHLLCLCDSKLDGYPITGSSQIVPESDEYL